MNSLAKIILTVIPALKISKAFRLKLLFIKFLKVFIKDFLGPIKLHQNPIGPSFMGDDYNQNEVR